MKYFSSHFKLFLGLFGCLVSGLFFFTPQITQAEATYTCRCRVEIWAEDTQAQCIRYLDPLSDNLELTVEFERDSSVVSPDVWMTGNNNTILDLPSYLLNNVSQAYMNRRDCVPVPTDDKINEWFNYAQNKIEGTSMQITPATCPTDVEDLNFKQSLQAKINYSSPNFSGQKGDKSGQWIVNVVTCEGAGFVSSTTGLDVGGGPQDSVITLTNPIGGSDLNRQGIIDPNIIIGNIANTIVGILGSFALLAFTVGGFMWLTSAGSPEKIKMGSQAMLWAVIGLFVVLTSYAIISTLLQGITT